MNVIGLAAQQPSLQARTQRRVRSVLKAALRPWPQAQFQLGSWQLKDTGTNPAPANAALGSSLLPETSQPPVNRSGSLSVASFDRPIPESSDVLPRRIFAVLKCHHS